MIANGHIYTGKPGRPKRIVDIQRKALESDFNIPHIIGHNIPPTENVVKQVSQTDADRQKNSVNVNPMNVSDGEVVDPSDVTVDNNKDSSPSHTPPKQKGGQSENSAENKKGIESMMMERMKGYVDRFKDGRGGECICFHCRTYGDRFVIEMKKMVEWMMRGENEG